MGIAQIIPEAGYVTFVYDDGTRTRHSIATWLRSADIPIGLTHTQVEEISKLANLVAIIIRTLIDRQVLDDSFLEDNDFDLQALTEAIENMGGDYYEPDISVS